MSTNIYQTTERQLYSYMGYKASCEALKMDIEELNDVVGIKGESDNKIKPTTQTYQFNSTVESEAIDRLDNAPIKIAAINRKIRSLERMINKIDSAVNSLSESDQEFIQLRYYHELKLDDVANRLGIARDTATRRRRKIMRKLITVFN